MVPITNEIVCVQDIEDYAFKVLPKKSFDYYRSGAGSQESLRNNRNAFLSYRIKPRVLKNVAVRDLSTTILGEKVSMPIGISPTALQKMAHPDGECATARAAQEMKTIFILSTLATSSIEEVAAAAPFAIKWFQLYIYKNRDITQKLVVRAEKAGFKAIVLTVDAPIFGRRRADIRNNFSLSPHLRLANFADHVHTDIVANKNDAGSHIAGYVNKLFDPSLEWNDIKWLQSITTLPIILKGILTSEDAIKAASMDVAGIFVSNHGGRQIDSVPSAIDVLSEIVEAVGRKVDVYLDGGIREGIDVFKSLALGAKMVFVGRPAVWGLAYAGEKGVCQMLSILKNELDETLALTGCTALNSITPDMVVHKNYYSHL